MLATFARFQQGSVSEQLSNFTDAPDMDPVEAAVLDLVALLFPDTFGALDVFCAARADFLEVTLRDFDREVQFYLAWLRHIQPLRQAGLAFDYPQLTTTGKAGGEDLYQRIFPGHLV